jgi:hypothetical protein
MAKAKVEQKIEETAAAETLKTHSRSDIMSMVAVKLAGKSYEDLSKWFNDSMALLGHEADTIPGGAAAQNQATLATHAVAKEEVDTLLAAKELSEEDRASLTTLFEAAVNQRVSLATVALEEKFQADLTEQVAAARTQIEEKVDEYLDYVADKWFQENQVAIETSLQVELAKSFMEGMKKLFVEHNVELPEAKEDVLTALTAEVEALKAQVNEKITAEIELKKVNEQLLGEKLYTEVTEGLSATEAAKFATLTETVKFDGDAEAYKTKLETIKTAHFTGQPTPKVAEVIAEDKKDSAASDIVDGVAPETLTEEVVLEPTMARYVAALTKDVKTVRRY